ncbi:hypothetical protein [Chitinophaga rhizosphaerae]|uniref:hypothetical protein n=1 Tax=Chitinophaga rhizosphaerae TaxID=1864947 RepID=UPI000F7FBEC2|nr:hypothetical protein [Chitinophaga rhizosphaerae]
MTDNNLESQTLFLMLIEPQYLFYLHYASVQSQVDQDSWLTEAKPCADLWRCINEIGAIPLDQLHPETAAAQGYERFVIRMEIIRLSNGDHEGSLIVLPHSTGEMARNAGLLVRGELAELVKHLGIPFEHTMRDDQSHYITIAGRLGDADYFAFSRAFCTLVQNAFAQMQKPDAWPFPETHLLSLKTFDLREVIVGEDGLINRPIERQFFVNSPAEALAKLLMLPSGGFDEKTARDLGFDHYWFEASIHKQDELAPIAFTVNHKPPREKWTLSDEKNAGRLLVFESALTDVVEQIGLQVTRPDGANPNVVVRLDEWNVDSDHLEPTDETKAIVANLPIVHADLLAPTRFTSMQTFSFDHLGSKLGIEGIIALKQHIGSSDDLQPLLFRLLAADHTSFDLNTAKKLDDPHQITGAMILDNEGNILFQMGTHNQVLPGAKPGIYMGVSPVLLQEKSLQALAPQQLTLDQGGAWIEGGDLRYAKIADLTSPSIYISPGFGRFSLMLESKYISSLLEKFPERALYDPSATLRAAAYYVELEWKLTHPGTQNIELFVHHIPCDNPNDAFKTANDHRSLFRNRRSLIDFELSAISVLQQIDRAPVLTIFSDIGNPSVSALLVDKAAMSPACEAAYDQFLKTLNVVAEVKAAILAASRSAREFRGDDEKKGPGLRP